MISRVRLTILQSKSQICSKWHSQSLAKKKDLRMASATARKEPCSRSSVTLNSLVTRSKIEVVTRFSRNCKNLLIARQKPTRQECRKHWWVEHNSPRVGSQARKRKKGLRRTRDRPVARVYSFESSEQIKNVRRDAQLTTTKTLMDRIPRVPSL